jgi:hypothetical protein
MIDIGKPRPEKFWQGGWVFVDTTSPLWPEVQNILLPDAQIDVTLQDRTAYEDRMGEVLGYPVLRYPRDMGDHKTVRYMDETERQILAKLCEKEDASEVEVTGLEYWDEAGNMTTWKTCRAPNFLTVVSHLVSGGRFHFRVVIHL